jgi:hypothetical protein
MTSNSQLEYISRNFHWLIFGAVLLVEEQAARVAVRPAPLLQQKYICALVRNMVQTIGAVTPDPRCEGGNSMFSIMDGVNK